MPTTAINLFIKFDFISTTLSQCLRNKITVDNVLIKINMLSMVYSTWDSIFSAEVECTPRN